jgi:hypothetical protein
MVGTVLLPKYEIGPSTPNSLIEPDPGKSGVDFPKAWADVLNAREPATSKPKRALLTEVLFMFKR